MKKILEFLFGPIVFKDVPDDDRSWECEYYDHGTYLIRYYWRKTHFRRLPFITLKKEYSFSVTYEDETSKYRALFTVPGWRRPAPYDIIGEYLRLAAGERKVVPLKDYSVDYST